MMSDEEIEARVREALEHGSISEASQWADSIQNDVLWQQMAVLIREYQIDFGL